LSEHLGSMYVASFASIVSRTQKKHELTFSTSGTLPWITGTVNILINNYSIRWTWVCMHKLHAKRNGVYLFVQL
jgi:hypothetical protein